MLKYLNPCLINPIIVTAIKINKARIREFYDANLNCEPCLFVEDSRT